MKKISINLKLTWNESSGDFQPTSIEDKSEGVFLELFESEKKWRYYYTQTSGLIARRTALRTARGIAKTGYIHPGPGARYGGGGVDFKLEEEKDQDAELDDNLKKSQRDWYGGHYKDSGV